MPAAARNPNGSGHLGSTREHTFGVVLLSCGHPAVVVVHPGRSIAATIRRYEWECPETGAIVTAIRVLTMLSDLTEWNKANLDTVYDPDLFRREILPGLGTVPLAEIMEAAGCCKASASDYRRGKRAPHVSTWQAFGAIVDANVESAAPCADSTWGGDGATSRPATHDSGM